MSPRYLRVGVLVAVLSACGSGRPAHAYDISQTAQNTSTGAYFGQKLVLYGGQAVQMEDSSNFDKRTAAVAATATALNYSFSDPTKSVAAGGSGNSFARVGANSALIKSWVWTNQAGTPVANATAISGYVSSAPTTPPSQINGPQPRSTQPPGQGITAYWTFINLTDQPAFIQGGSFQFLAHFVDGGDIFSPIGPANVVNEVFFGGAKPGGRGGLPIFLPPHGGTTLTFAPIFPPQGTDLWIQVDGVASADGVSGDVAFRHRSSIPNCDDLPNNNGFRDLDGGSAWRYYLVRYLRAQKDLKDGVRSGSRDNTLANGDLIINLAQVYANAENAAFPGVDVHISDLLDYPFDKKDYSVKARGELAALFLNLAAGKACWDDLVDVPGGTDKPLKDVINAAAAAIVNGSSRAQRDAYRLLHGINTSQIGVHVNTIP